MVGNLRIIFLLILNFLIINHFMGMQTALIATTGIAFYAWLGEYLALFQDRVVRKSRLAVKERLKVEGTFAQVIEDVKVITGKDIKSFEIHVLSSKEMNAYAYGLKHVAVTRGLLEQVDSSTLKSILAHESWHTIQKHGTFRRVFYVSVFLILLFLAGASNTAIILICMAYIAFTFTGRIRNTLFGAIQRIILIPYRVTSALISRKFEYRADLFSADVYGGNQLIYFMEKYMLPQESVRSPWAVALYSTHPPTEKRIVKLKELYNSQYISFV